MITVFLLLNYWLFWKNKENTSNELCKNNFKNSKIIFSVFPTNILNNNF